MSKPTIDDFRAERVDGVRDWLHMQLNQTDDSALPAALHIDNGETSIVIIPSAGDGVLGVDLYGFVNGTQTLFAPNALVVKTRTRKKPQ